MPGSGVAQRLQNRAPLGFSYWQEGHSIPIGLPRAVGLPVTGHPTPLGRVAEEMAAEHSGDVLAFLPFW
jgi:hypothetical protein